MYPRLLLSAALCLGMLLLPPAPARAQTADPSLLDVIQTLQARKVLDEDTHLGPLHLGLKMRGGVATLWGPVPSLDLSRRAVQKLRALVYVSDIRNHLAVQADDYLPPAPPRMVTPASAPTPMAPAPAPKTPRPGREVPAEASLPAIVVPVPQESLRIPLPDDK